MDKKQKKLLERILLSAAIFICLQLISTEDFDRLGQWLFPGAGRWLRLLAYLINYYIIGWATLKKAFKGIRNRQVFDENFLMAVATLGALAIAVYENGDYAEAIAVMLFYQVGEWFEGYAVGKSRRNISQLMDIRPDYANIEQEGELIRVDPEELEPGSIIVVQPGEKVPVDGVVIHGSSMLNTSALTGESLPREVNCGDEIISGCINTSGLIKVRTTRRFEESTVSKILELVENAGERKSRQEDFISKFARVYTPAVCYGALALALLPPLVRLLFMGLDAQWGTWLYRALTFLVISCPCALVISIPLSFFAGIGGASRAGILIKGSNFLEALSKTDCLVFDKTGTLTQGVFAVEGIHHSTMDDKQLLEYAALAESASSHPISRSLQRAHGRQPDRSRVEDIREISGRGVVALVDKRQVAAGNDKLMRELGVEYKDCHNVGTVIHMAIDGEYAGHILISDILKANARRAVAALKELGIRKTVMLTGDTETVAEHVAAKLGIDRVYSRLLPGDKVEKLEELLKEETKGGKLAFAGDGINDAPVLARADIGIAMGALGSDAAIEAADVVLMDDDPMKIAKAIKISRKCLTIVYENIVFAIGIKLICLALGALGLANMWLAIFADVGVMVLAVLNAMRCLFVYKL